MSCPRPAHPSWPSATSFRSVICSGLSGTASPPDPTPGRPPAWNGRRPRRRRRKIFTRSRSSPARRINITKSRYPLHQAGHLAHQFEDAAQQKEASTLGMWAFLATELMFFGGALTAFVVYRSFYADAFAQASKYHMHIVAGTVNTAV